MKTKDIITVIFKALDDCIDNVLMPIGKNLIPTTVIVLILAIFNTILHFLNLYSVLDYRGCWLCFVLMLIPCFQERRSNRDILRLYRTAQLYLDKVEGWKERASSSEGDSGDSGDSVNSDTETDESERGPKCD